MFAFLNGKILSEEKAKISPADRGFLLGDGLFETMRSYSGKIFALEEHIERLFSSAKVFSLEIGYSEKELAQACDELLDANKLKDARIRITVSRGEFKGELGLGWQSPSTVLITTKPLAERKSGEERLKLKKANFSLSEDYFFAKHKIVSYLPYLFAYDYARKNGADDAVLFSCQGFLLEASRANLFLVKDEVLKTPSLELPLLAGITRKKILEIARKLGIKVEEGKYRESELVEADGVFLTNSVIELVPVLSYEGKIYSDKKAQELIKKLQDAYHQLVCPQF